jgi:hypothetical protein
VEVRFSSLAECRKFSLAEAVRRIAEFPLVVRYPDNLRRFQTRRVSDGFVHRNRVFPLNTSAVMCRSSTKVPGFLLSECINPI